MTPPEGRASLALRMNRPVTSIGFILLILLGLGSATAGDVTEAGAKGEDVIVIFRAGTSAGQRDLILREAGALPGRQLQRAPATAARLPSANVRATLIRHPDVVAVVPDSPSGCPCQDE